MKKILFLLTSFVMSGMLFAANITAKATLSITSEHVTSAIQLKLYESPDYTADKETTVEAEAMLNPVATNAYVVNFYATCSWGSGKASKLAEFDLIGTKMTFQSNRLDNEYTMSFSNIVGTLYMKDLVTEDIIEIKEGVEPYVFTQDADNSSIERFEIVAAPAPEADYTRDVTSGNWYTICLPYASSSFTGMDLYKVAGYNAQEGFGVDPVVGQMVAGMPYIFQATAATIEVSYTGEPVNAPVDGANYLVGTFTGTTTPAQAYVVANNMLNWVANATVPENRAYLNYADITDGNFPVANAAPGRKFIAAPKGITTDLNQLTDSPVGRFNKYIIDGRFVIMKDGQKYNVLGM